MPSCIDDPDNHKDLIRQVHLKCLPHWKELEQEAEHHESTRDICDVVLNDMVVQSIASIKLKGLPPLVPLFEAQEKLNFDCAVQHTELLELIWKHVILAACQLYDVDLALLNSIQAKG